MRKNIVLEFYRRGSSYDKHSTEIFIRVERAASTLHILVIYANMLDLLRITHKKKLKMGRLKLILNNISSLESELTTLYQQLIQEKDDMFDAIVETIPDFIAIIQNDRFVFVNSAGLSLLLCENLNDIIGKNIFEILHPDLHITIKDRIKNLKEQKDNEPIRIKLRRTNGDFIDLEASSKPFTYNNQAAGLIAGRDITRELAQKQKLKEEENLRSIVLNSFPELIAFYEPNHKIRWMNDAAKKFYGIDDDSYIGQYCYAVKFSSDKPCSDCPMLMKVDETIERTVYDRNTIWRIRHTPIFDSQAAISGYIELSVDITKKEKRKAELKEAQRKIAEGEQRFREVFENSHDSLFLLEVTDDLRFRNLDFNPAFERATGLKRTELIGKFQEEAVSEETAKIVNSNYRRCVEEKTAVVNKEIELKLPTGTRSYLSSIIPISDSNGNIYRILGITHDVTERKQLDQLLKREKVNLEEAQRIGKIGSWELDLSTDHIERSAEIFRIYEMDRGNKAVSPSEFIALIHPEDRDRVLRKHADSFENQQTYTVDYRLLFPDGRLKYVSEKCETVCDDQSRPLRCMGIVQDVTEQKLDKRNIELLSTALNNANDAVFISDDTGLQFIYVNTQACRSLDYNEKELLQLSFFDIDADQGLELRDRINTQSKDQRGTNFETKLKRKDGSTFSVEVSLTFLDFDGKKYNMCHVRDITERKQNLERIEMLGFALNKASEGVFIREENVENFMYVNDHACLSLGYRREELLELMISDFDPYISMDSIKKNRADLANRKTSSFESIHKTKEGRLFPVEITNTFYKYNNKTYIMSIVQDISERKRADELVHLREQEFRTLAENSPDTIVRYDKKANRIYVNPIYLKAANRKADEIIGSSTEQLTHLDADSAVSMSNIVKQVIATEKEASFTLCWGNFYFDVKAVPEFDRNGGLVSVLTVARDITERKRAEQTLRESEQRYRLVFENSPVSIWEEDFSGIKLLFDQLKRDGISDIEACFNRDPEIFEKCVRMVKINDVNQSALSLHEATSKQELLDNFTSTFTDQFFLTFKKELVGIWKGEKKMEIDSVVQTLSGKLVHVTVFFTVCSGYENSLSKVLVSVVDITERKKMEAAISQLNADLNATLGAIPDLLVEVDSNGTYINIWENQSDSLLTPKELLLGRSAFDVLPTHAAEVVKSIMAEAQRSGHSTGHSYHLDFPSGRRWFELSVAKKTNFKHLDDRFIAIVRDISDRIKAESAWRESQSRLTKAELVASIGHTEYNIATGIYNWSDGAYEILNIPKELRVPCGESFHELIHQEDRERVDNAIRRAIENLSKFDETYRIKDFNGMEKIIHGTGHTLQDENGCPCKFFSIIRNITETYQLNTRINEEEEKFKILAENAPVGIFLSINETPLYINKALLKISGFDSLESFSRINPIELVHPEDRMKIVKLSKKIETEPDFSSFQLTLRNIPSEKQVKFFDLRFIACRINGQRYIQVMVIDITDEIEKEKIRAQLATDALYINQKNCITKEIEEELNTIFKFKEAYKPSDFEGIFNILRTYSQSDKDWELLQKHFDCLHPDFIANLKSICPSITVTDIKHCACIRLNLNTKETARFFNVAPTSIQTSRVRLKKKLELPTTTDLRDFILSI